MPQSGEDQFEDMPPDAYEALGDPDGPQPCDLHDQDQTDTEPCPSCGRQIADLAERCPYCGDWVVRGERSPASNRSLFFAAIVILLLIALLYWLL